MLVIIVIIIISWELFLLSFHARGFVLVGTKKIKNNNRMALERITHPGPLMWQNWYFFRDLSVEFCVNREFFRKQAN